MTIMRKAASRSSVFSLTAATRLLFSPKSNQSHYYNKIKSTTTFIRNIYSSDQEGDGRRRRGGRDGGAYDSAPPSNRPLREDRRPTSPSFSDRPLRGDRRSAPPLPSERPLRGDRRPTSPPPINLGSNSDDDDEKGFGDSSSSRRTSTYQTKPPSGGGRELRGGGGGGGREEIQTPPLFDSSTRPSTREDQAPTQGDKTFLEKFKLGFDGKENKQPQSDREHETPAAVGESPQPQDADEIFKKMKETGLIPNAVAMLDGLCKDGLVQDAMKLFGLMREKGTIPEVVIYTAVVDGFCKAHKFDDAKRIFRKMQNNGISPNAFSYTVLIQGLCKGKFFDDAVDFSIEMLEASHSPNVSTFTSLINGVCKDRGVDEAASIVKRLTDKGFFVNDKAVREHIDKKGPFSPLVSKAIFGDKYSSQTLF